MALGFAQSNNDGGEFLPTFRFNAVSGDAVIVSSEKSGDGWEKKEVDVKFPCKLIFDFENIMVGWLHFAATGPSFSLVKIGEQLPVKPSADHKQGFKIKLYSKEYGVCEFANSSKTIATVIDALHDQYLAGVKANAGRVPVVEIKGTKKVQVTTKEGTKNYKQPDWSIVSWVARPEALIVKAAPSKVEDQPIDDDDF